MEEPSPVTAAQTALATGDVGAAIALAREALAAGPDPAARQFLGGLLFIDDDFAGARREWELAFRQWRDAGEPRTAALVAADLADLHTSALGNRVAGQGWIARGRRLLAPVGRCPELGYVELALIACDVGVEQLLRAAEGALDLARDFADGELEALALADMGYALVVQGNTAQGFAALDEAMAALSAGEVAKPAVIGKSFCALLSACDRTGDVARAEEWIRVVTGTLTGPLGGRPRATHSHCRLVYGSVLCAAGRWPEGEDAIREVLGPEGSAFLTHRAEAAARLASVRLLQGRTAEAAELLAPFEDRVSTCEPLARLHLLAGDLDVAAATAQRGLAGTGEDRLRAASLYSVLVDVELARGDIEAAAAHAGSLVQLAERVHARAVSAQAAVAHARVAAALGDHDGALSLVDAARAHVSPDEHPLLWGVVAGERAHALAAVGHRGAAIDEARAALSVFARLGANPLADRTRALLRSLGAGTPPIDRRPHDTVSALSEREREVLRLLRDGLTNAEIGQRLFISPKTAEHHVGRLLAKLGVRSRAEAAAVGALAGLAPEGPPPAR